MSKAARKEQPVEKLLYRPSTAAQILDMSSSMVYKLVAQGELEGRKVGRSLRIPADALRRFIEGAEAAR